MSDTIDATAPAPAPGKGLSITALVLGILGFFTCALTALPGLIIGIIALAKGRPGKGMAIAGVVCSGVSFLLIPVLAAMPAIGMVRVNANKAKDGNNLKVIATYIIAYDQDEGKPPADLAALQQWSNGDIMDKWQVSPVGDGQHPYLYIRPVDRSGFSAGLPLVMGDPDAFGSGSNIAFGDGHYEWWPESRARPLWNAVTSAPEGKAWTAAELKALITAE